MLKTRERKRGRKAGGKRMEERRKVGGSEEKEGGKRGEKRVERGWKRGRKEDGRGWNRERIEQRADTPAGMPALLCVLKRGSAYWAGDITTSNTLPAATSLARSA